MAVVILHRHLTQENHAELLLQAVGKNRLQLETIAVGLAPRAEPPDRIKLLRAPPASLIAAASERVAPVSAPGVPTAAPKPPERPEPSRIRFEFTADGSLLEMIQRARALLWHKFPHGRLEDVFAEALEALLDKRDPDRRIARIEARKAKPSSG